MTTKERLQEIKAKYKNGVPEGVNSDDDDLEYEEEFEWKGRLYTVKELADIAGINTRTMSCRLDRYKTMAEVMAVEPSEKRTERSTETKRTQQTKKIGKVKLYLYHGDYYNVSQLARLVGMHKNTLFQRLKVFDNVEDAINKPYNTKARNNITKMLKAGGINKETFYKACKKGVTLKEFFGVKE